MRQIERNMLAAIWERRDWKQDNTCVDFAQHVGSPFLEATVYLHGNPIAEVMQGKGGLEVQANLATFDEWPSMTTGSRLHALGIPNKVTRTTRNHWVSEAIHELPQPDAIR